MRDRRAAFRSIIATTMLARECRRPDDGRVTYRAGALDRVLRRWLVLGKLHGHEAYCIEECAAALRAEEAGLLVDAAVYHGH